MALSLDGNTLVVSAPFENAHGAFYVYTRRESKWLAFGHKLIKPNDQGGNQYFAEKVVISDDGMTIVASCSNHPVTCTGAFVYRRTSNGFVFAQELHSDDVLSTPQAHDVAISGDGNTICVRPTRTTFAIVWKRSRGSWTQFQVLPAPQASFGDYCALSKDASTIIVGTHFESAPSSSAFVYTFVNTLYDRNPSILSLLPQSTSIILSRNGRKLVVGSNAIKGGVGGAACYTRPSASSEWRQVGGIINTTDYQGTQPLEGSALALSDDNSLLAMGGPGDGNLDGSLWMFGSLASTRCAVASNDSATACASKIAYCDQRGIFMKWSVCGGCMCAASCAHTCQSGCQQDVDCRWNRRTRKCVQKRVGAAPTTNAFCR